MRIEQEVRSIKEKKKEDMKKEVENFIYDENFNNEKFNKNKKINENKIKTEKYINEKIG